jgi:RNA polymerase sigma-70 factor (ECF subfamily)
MAPGGSSVTSSRLGRLPSDGDLSSDAAVTAELLKAAKAADQDAWELLYHLYSGRLLAFLMMKLSHNDDANEALSETWLRAIEKVGTFRGEPESMRPWLFAIGRNVAIDRLRARKRTLGEPDPDVLANVVDLTVLDVDEHVIGAQERRAVSSALENLPADDREVLWLRFGQGMSSDEVAKVVGKRAGAVRMQQMRALQSLSETMQR